MPEVTIDISVQDPEWERIVPGVEKFVTRALRTVMGMAILPHLAQDRELEISVILANDDLSHVLNRDYRGKDKPTNVLTFATLDDEDEPVTDGPLALGDVFLARETLQRESMEQHKTLEDHFAHLCVHGALHLLGYDHIEEDDATMMESLEIRILEKLGIQNPYFDPPDVA